jgi:hypothetical protein
MRCQLLLLGVLCSACAGKSSPTAPSTSTTTTTVPAIPTTITLTGHVTATNGGQSLAGVQAVLGASSSLTDGTGEFRAELLPTASLRLALTGSGIVPRTLTVATAASRAIAVNAIALGGSFDLAFYRQLVRNGFEAPATLQPLRRWTRTPAFYLKTEDEAGRVIDAYTLAQVEATVRDAVPQWTAGLLGIPVVERGTASREGQSGWITIKFPAEVATYCGRAQIAVDGGWIELNAHIAPSANGACRVPGADVVPGTVRHEIGHALGRLHTDSPKDLMWGGTWSDPNQKPSARELAAAAIAYTRPVGNLDPDSDPTSSVNLAPMTVR